MEQLSYPVGPFKATNIWHDVIKNITEKVDIKKRRVRLRTYENCFTGSGCVDVVLETLQENSAILTQPISRAKAVKLCQLLLDSNEICNVYSSASILHEKQTALFEDSSSRYYKFPSDIENKENNEKYRNSVSIKNTESTVFSRKNTLRSSYLLTPRLSCKHRSDSKKTNADSLKSIEIEEIWRDVALSFLLRIVDLPILDSILSYEIHQESEGVNNMAFQRTETSVSSVWIESLLDCFDCFGFPCSNLDTSSTGGRLTLFESLKQHMHLQKTCLWPDVFSDLQVAIYGLMMQDKFYDTVRALQLSVLLLKPKIRQQLKRLLIFMYVASNDFYLQLSRTETNKTIIERSFSNYIIKSKLLTNHQKCQLTLFMTRYCKQIFIVPEFVQRSVQKRILAISCGKNFDTTEMNEVNRFCEKIDIEEYEEKVRNCTEESIVDLINVILDDTKMPLKDKKRRLKDLKKTHDDIFKKFFPKLNDVY